MNTDFYVNVASLMLPKPSRKHKRILYEDGKKIPIITVEIGVLE